VNPACHLKSFDLPSESEPRFTVNPDPDPTIEYALIGVMSDLMTLPVLLLLACLPRDAAMLARSWES